MKAQKTIFLHYGFWGFWCTSKKTELANCVKKNHIQKSCGRLPKKSFSARGYTEIHKQRPFLDNKNSIWKKFGLKIGTVGTCSTAFSIHRNFYFWKISKSQFLVEFQSFFFGQIFADFRNFGQFWAVLGRICCIHSGLEKFSSCPTSSVWHLNLHNFWSWCQNWKIKTPTRRSPNGPPSIKISENLDINCIHRYMPKFQKSPNVADCPLKVKWA